MKPTHKHDLGIKIQPRSRISWLAPFCVLMWSLCVFDLFRSSKTIVPEHCTPLLFCLFVCLLLSPGWSITFILQPFFPACPRDIFSCLAFYLLHSFGYYSSVQNIFFCVIRNLLKCENDIDFTKRCPVNLWRTENKIFASQGSRCSVLWLIEAIRHSCDL